MPEYATFLMMLGAILGIKFGEMVHEEYPYFSLSCTLIGSICVATLAVCATR